MRDVVDISYLNKGYLNLSKHSFDYLDDPQVQQVYKVFVGFCIFYMPIIILSSALVFWGIVLYPGFHNTNNYLLLSLSIADFLMGTFCLPMNIISNLPNTKHIILSNKHACLTWFSSMILAGAGSLHTLLFIAIDRYIAVMFPLKYHTLVTQRRAIAMIVLLWCYLTALAFLPMSGWHHYQEDVFPLMLRCNFYATLPFAYVVWASTTTVLVTIGLSTVLNIQIIYVAFRQVSHFRQQMLMFTPKQIKRFENRVSSIKITTFLMMLFIILWLPYLLVAPFKYYSAFTPKNMEIARVVAQIINFASSLVNVPVYSIGRHEYKEVYKVMLTTLPWHWKYELRNLYRDINAGIFSRETLYTSEQLSGHYASKTTSEGTSVKRHESELFRFSFDKSTSVDSAWMLQTDTTASEYISKKFVESESLRKQSLYSAFHKGTVPEQHLGVNELADELLMCKLTMDRQLALSGQESSDDVRATKTDLADNFYIRFYQYIVRAGTSVDQNVSFYELFKHKSLEDMKAGHKTYSGQSELKKSLFSHRFSSESSVLKKKSLFSEMFEHQNKTSDKVSSSKKKKLSFFNLQRKSIFNKDSLNKQVSNSKFTDVKLNK